MGKWHCSVLSSGTLNRPGWKLGHGRAMIWQGPSNHDESEIPLVAHVVFSLIRPDQMRRLPRACHPSPHVLGASEAILGSLNGDGKLHVSHPSVFHEANPRFRITIEFGKAGSVQFQFGRGRRIEISLVGLSQCVPSKSASLQLCG